MKALSFFLILSLFLGTALTYLQFPVPVGKVNIEGADFDTSLLKAGLGAQSFILARLPDFATLKSLDGGLKDVVLERYFPFDLQVRWVRYNVLLILSLKEKTWELLDNGDFVENPRVMPTATCSVYIWPLPQEIRGELATLMARIPDRLRKTIRALEVDSSEKVVLQLDDGLKCFFSLSNYEKHMAYLEVYINRARKDGKKELHFEYSEVYAK
ncbi:MAG: hypothetical protein QMD88_08420 [Coprothermobacterota bacterium]|jgi:cell division septal protein FtsQ|nr:hypothetical protein [Coprothermobacterota bacterium]